MTINDLIDYLNQFEGDTLVFLSTDDVPEPCEFIALNTIPGIGGDPTGMTPPKI